MMSTTSLIDGGPKGNRNYRKDYFANVKKCLEDYNAIDMIAWEETVYVVHCNIIVTHPDQDHVNGITKLMEEYDINGMIIITEAFHRKWRIEDCSFLQYFFDNLTLKHSLVSSWSPASWQPLSSTENICCQSPEERCLCYVPHAHAYYYQEYYLGAHAYLGPLHRGSNRDWNKSSILTTIRKSDTEYAAVLTGDSFSDIVLSTSGLVGNHTQIFQVPHHGSKYSIKVGKGGTLDMCTELYSSFTADVYVISGSDKNHPQADILSGILNAVYYQKKEKITKIVLTGSHGLSAEKMIKSTRMPTGRDYQNFFRKKCELYI